MEADLAAVAALIADPSRAAMLDALIGGEPMTAGSLARIAGVAPSTASGHLARLERGGLVVSERRGRARQVRLAGPGVARALEALAAVAPLKRPSGLKAWQHGEARGAARAG
jgi:DNA-binding transcriptional ArsR family regulator